MLAQVALGNAVGLAVRCRALNCCHPQLPQLHGGVLPGLESLGDWGSLSGAAGHWLRLEDLARPTYSVVALGGGIEQIGYDLVWKLRLAIFVDDSPGCFVC